MGVNVHRKLLIETIESKRCPSCGQDFAAEDNFCRLCGSKLVSTKIKVYANLGKRGVTSYSYVLPDGKTFNSKGKLTFKIGNGISFTQDV
ncbi:MAG: hypothetical protein K6D97_07410 [Clostridia bacterium]|nr:hypothetical protein [Clostridia bacterium]